VVGVLEKLSSSVIDYWKREEEAKLIQCLDTPDRKAYEKEQLALHLAEARLKHAKLEKEMAFAEAPPKEVDSVTTITTAVILKLLLLLHLLLETQFVVHVPLAVICSECKLRCHEDCVDDEDCVITVRKKLQVVQTIILKIS